ncbi:MAG: hypothetical protein BGP06_18340 [Rhizobiales bacterium 65-9]|nr:MAG: hypothetical protein BGP06_18340 [Rhizobiales bacterium 65-9]
MSCRSCGRDLTPVLPLIRRLAGLEIRINELEQKEARQALALPAPTTPPVEIDAAASPRADGRRSFPALFIGFVALIAGYWLIVIWLDLPLSVLRFLSIALPFVVGALYFGPRARLTWFDVCVAVVFACASVAAMNALLGWIDSIPMTPQGTAAWRETFFYALSIGASMFSGMILRVLQKALSAHGLTSIPRLRQSILAMNGKVPMDMLKAIELTILGVSAVLSALTGIVFGFLGIGR